MNGVVSDVVVVGGGTAGWLTACLIAASADPAVEPPLTVTLIESPDIPTIGVGEGTWPTMRRTLERIGLAEADFLLACDASFKQGSRFDGWLTGADDDFYYHPFTPPVAASPRDLIAAWRAAAPDLSFADAMGPQPALCARQLAPRERGAPGYAGAVNYAYHLDAVKLAALLSAHGRGKLGVRHLVDHVTAVRLADDGDIAAVDTRSGGQVTGDLFIDCTGQAALLIGGRYGVPFVDRGDMLFNDRALAVQVPVAPGSAIASQTISTAHATGWIWDIGLPARRGIGCVYSSRHAGDDQAAALDAYLDRAMPDLGERPAYRRLSFATGHRARFWERNCLAVGLSAGFIEPLESSAIVLIELSLDALLDNFPRDRAAMDFHARRFNDLFRFRWDRIVEFLKLHYVLSRRDEPYWRDHRDPASIPERLRDLLALWRDQPPSPADLGAVDELFPAASYQYVLYGMGFPPPPRGVVRLGAIDPIAAQLAQAHQRGRALAAALPTNRAYLDALRSVTPSLMPELTR